MNAKLFARRDYERSDLNEHLDMGQLPSVTW